jgi:LuxR family maltose regulon positive regulatory protein
MPEVLERANLFVVALGDEGQWYCYHHLFAAMLRSRFSQTMPALVPDLHRRTSTWREQHDLMEEALNHARLEIKPMKSNASVCSLGTR